MPSPGIASLRYRLAMTKTIVIARSDELDEGDDLSSVALAKGEAISKASPGSLLSYYSSR